MNILELEEDIIMIEILQELKLKPLTTKYSLYRPFLSNYSEDRNFGSNYYKCYLKYVKYMEDIDDDKKAIFFDKLEIAGIGLTPKEYLLYLKITHRIVKILRLKTLLEKYDIYILPYMSSVFDELRNANKVKNKSLEKNYKKFIKNMRKNRSIIA